MANELMIPTAWHIFRWRVYKILRRPYLVAGCIAYLFVGLLVTSYVSQPSSYRSNLDLVLPGTGASNQVSLDEVGQVVSSTNTPFASRVFNPRVNYKEILMSRGLINNAAEKLDISPSKFGIPKIRLTEQTSILNVEISGRSPEEAQQKAWLLYEGLQEELDRLRADETALRDDSIKEVLMQYRERLDYARTSIVHFQQRSVIVSEDQLTQLISILSKVKEKQLYVKAEVKRINDFVTQLSADLGVSASMAGQAFALQSDSQFLAYLAEMKESSTQLSEFSSRWGEKHPMVIAEQARFDQAKNAILFRSEQLVGLSASTSFASLDLQNNPKLAQLFSDLIESYANYKGELAELEQLKLSQQMLEDKIKVYAREAAELERLNREFDLAEAIFTSAAARLKAGKADVFASYPVIQLLTEPSFPEIASTPKPALGTAAGILGAVFITSGLLVIRKRREIVSVLLKKPL